MFRRGPEEDLWVGNNCLCCLGIGYVERQSGCGGVCGKFARQGDCLQPVGGEQAISCCITGLIDHDQGVGQVAYVSQVQLLGEQGPKVCEQCTTTSVLSCNKIAEAEAASVLHSIASVVDLEAQSHDAACPVLSWAAVGRICASNGAQMVPVEWGVD